MNLSPFQQKLKESTQDIHSACENHTFMQSMINGTVTQKQHLKFLANVLPIYNVVEQRLLAKDLFKVEDLKRSDYIEGDINTLISNFEDKEALVFTVTPLDVTTEWVSRAWKKPVDLLKAELYTRWLADFYGGRILAKRVTPNASYTCNNPQNVITYIRDLLDNPLNGVTEDELIEETTTFFKYHLVLFDEIVNGNS
jgi:heme oxygenase